MDLVHYRVSTFATIVDHTFLSSVIDSSRPCSLMSLLILSIHLMRGLPLGLFPGISISSTALVMSSGVLCFICPLDGYPASLGFPVMHRVHAMAYAPNLKGKGRFVNGWFVNILPPLKFPSLPCSHAPSLSRSIPPPLTSSLPSFPRAVHASFGPFLARSLHQPSP